jgi:membrane dipeptidase
MAWLDLHTDSLRRCVDRDADLLRAERRAEVDLPRLQAAGAVAAVWAACDDVYLDGAAGLAFVLRMLAAGRDLLARAGGELILVRTRADLARCAPGGPIGILLGLEGAHSLLGSLDLLDALHALGVRVLTLTWNHSNPFACGCAVAPGEDRGLSPLGRELLLRARERGMVIDLAHASPRTLADAIPWVRGRFMVSHTACASLVPHRRNLTDAQLRAVVEAGGLTGIMLYPPFLAANGEASLGTVAAHVRHAVDVVGERGVAMGTDLDGMPQLPAGVAGLQDLSGMRAALAAAGLRDEAIEGVLWRNAWDMLGAALPPDGA